MSPRKHEVPDELLSRLLANVQKPEDLIGENGLLKQLTKLLVQKALGSPPLSRTLTRRPIQAMRSVHVEATEVQCGVQARCG